MENDDLHSIWKKTGQMINDLDKEQLKIILMKKNKRIFFEFTVFYMVSLVISAGALVYLILSIVKRSNDGYFIFINALLLAFVVVSIIASFITIRNLRPAMPDNLNLQDFIHQKVGSLEKSCKQMKYQNPLIFFVTVLFALSIQVFYANRPFQNILTNGESLWATLFGLAVSIPLGMFLSRKIIKHYNVKLKQLKTNLEELKNSQA